MPSTLEVFRDYQANKDAGLVDYAYVADVGGSIYRVDFVSSPGSLTAVPPSGSINNSTDPTKWVMHKVAQTNLSGEGRKFLFGPALFPYQGKTYENLKTDPTISITAINEHRFSGYCLKGKARIISETSFIKEWEEKIVSRVTRRILKNIHEEKGHLRHPEVLMPAPKYMIIVRVNDIIDLTPQHIKQGRQ